MSTFGDALKAVRKERNITQVDMAKELCISQTHISNLENHLENPSRALIKLFCILYGFNRDSIEG